MQKDGKPKWLKTTIAIIGAVSSIIGAVALILNFIYPNNDIRSFRREIESGDANGAIEIYQKDILGDASAEARATSYLNEQLNRGLSNYSRGIVSAQSIFTMLDTISAVNDVIQIVDAINSYHDSYVAISESKAAFQLGETSYSSGEYKSAIDNFSKVIREDSENYETAQTKLNKSVSLYQDNVIARVRELGSRDLFDEAEVIIHEAESVIGSTPELLNIETELLTLEFNKSISTAFENKDYAAVIREYSQARNNEVIVISTEIEGVYSSSVAQFLEDAETQANEAFGNDKDYEAAINVLMNLSSQVEEDANVVASLNSMIEKYKEYIPIELLSLDYIQKGKYAAVGSTYGNNDMDVNGNQYDSNSIICASGGDLNGQFATDEDEASVIYNLNQKYSTLSGIIYRPYSSLSCEYNWSPAKVRIYGDNLLIYESPDITLDTYNTIEFTANVTGVRNLKIVTQGVWGEETPGWVGLYEYYPKACLTNLMIQK